MKDQRKLARPANWGTNERVSHGTYARDTAVQHIHGPRRRDHGRDWAGAGGGGVDNEAWCSMSRDQSVVYISLDV